MPRFYKAERWSPSRRERKRRRASETDRKVLRIAHLLDRVSAGDPKWCRSYEVALLRAAARHLLSARVGCDARRRRLRRALARLASNAQFVEAALRLQTTTETRTFFGIDLAMPGSEQTVAALLNRGILSVQYARARLGIGLP